MSQNTALGASIPESRLPETVARRLARPFVRFLEIQSASGVVLLLCTIVALVLANSRWAQAVHDFWHIQFRIGLGNWEISESLLHWVNDGLMTIFFFVVGLEIKRELIDGELREPKQAVLPIMAAFGGMLLPAVVYLLAQPGPEARSGWGIPMATDIAFVVGFLTLLGSRVPVGLKILLLALAIVDDIGAVLVIALFYSTNISFACWRRNSRGRDHLSLQLHWNTLNRRLLALGYCCLAGHFQLRSSSNHCRRCAGIDDSRSGLVGTARSTRHHW